MIEDKVRKDQIERIGQYRTDRNADEADALLAGLEGVTVEATEDRIAQLRDGRSAATFETELGGPFFDFTPSFLAFATSPTRPTRTRPWRRPSPPKVRSSSRRITAQPASPSSSSTARSRPPRCSGSPTCRKIRALLEDTGYDSDKIHDFRPLGRTGVWQGRLAGAIRPVRTDD